MNSALNYLWALLTSEAFFVTASVASVVSLVLLFLKFLYRPWKVRYSPKNLRVLTAERSYLRRLVAYLDDFDRATYWEDLLYTPLEAELKPLQLIPPEFMVLSRSKSTTSLVSQLGVDEPDASQRRYYDILKIFRNYKEPLIILGDPGAGKSISFRHAIRELVRDQSRWFRTKPLIPIYVQCGHYTGTENGAPVPVEQFLREYTGKAFRFSDQIELDFTEYLSEGRLMIFFDALDEMPRNDYSERTRLMKEFTRQYPLNRIFFSCRKLDYDKLLQVREVSIRPFDKHRRRTFLEKALSRTFNRSAIQQLIYQLETDSKSAELLSNPFFCQLVAFYVIATEQMPTNRYQLFSLYIDRRLKIEHARKNQDIPTPTSVIAILSKFAYLMAEAKGVGTSLKRSEVLELLTAEVIPYALAVSVVETSLRAKLLIETPDHELLQFSHHRLQEYFAALYAVNNIPWNTELVPRFCDDLWWREILIMMMGMGEQESARINTILDGTVESGRELLFHIIDECDSLIDAIHREQYHLEAKESDELKESYVISLLEILDPFVDDDQLVQNLMMNIQHYNRRVVIKPRRKNVRSSERRSTTLKGILAELFLAPREDDSREVYEHTVSDLVSHLQNRKTSLHAIRRLVVNRIALCLACATNCGLHRGSEIWDRLKRISLTALQKGTPLEQVKILKELIVQDSDTDVSLQLRLLLLGSSRWVSREVFGALLDFRIPHVGFDRKAVKYLWKEVDKLGVVDVVQEHVPRLLKSFVRVKSLSILTGLMVLDLLYILFFAGILPLTTYFATTIDYFGVEYFIKPTLAYPAFFGLALVCLAIGVFSSEGRPQSLIYGVLMSIGTVLFTIQLNSPGSEPSPRIGDTTPIALNESIKWVLIAVVLGLLTLKIIGVLLEYCLYFFEWIRFRGFRKALSKGIGSPDLSVEDLLGLYGRTRVQKIKQMIIQYLWQHAQFDELLINRLTELASEERSPALADSLWNLIYEIEKRIQRVA